VKSEAKAPRVNRREVKQIVICAMRPWKVSRERYSRRFVERKRITRPLVSSVAIDCGGSLRSFQSYRLLFFVLGATSPASAATCENRVSPKLP
jgi:hypothetical protein